MSGQLDDWDKSPPSSNRNFSCTTIFSIRAGKSCKNVYVAVIKSHLLSGSNEKIIEKLIEKKVKFWICCEIWRLYKENDTLDKRRFVADDQDDDYSRNCFSGLKGGGRLWVERFNVLTEEEEEEAEATHGPLHIEL